jgi:hypothetical protein
LVLCGELIDRLYVLVLVICFVVQFGLMSEPNVLAPAMYQGFSEIIFLHLGGLLMMSLWLDVNL